MAQLVSEDSKRNPVTAFWNFTTSFIWKFITSLDSFTKVFLIISLLVISVTPIIVKNRQTINQYASKSDKQCIPLPACAMDGRCPEILNNEIPNVRWCLPIPTSTPVPNTETIIRKVGEQEGSFLIQKINRGSVDGLWYQAYPVAKNQGTPKTLYIGDDIGYACEGVSERLTNIDFVGQTVTFTKIIGQPPMGGCPL